MYNNTFAVTDVIKHFIAIITSSSKHFCCCCCCCGGGGGIVIVVVVTVVLLCGVNTMLMLQFITRFVAAPWMKPHQMCWACHRSRWVELIIHLLNLISWHVQLVPHVPHWKKWGNHSVFLFCKWWKCMVEVICWVVLSTLLHHAGNSSYYRYCDNCNTDITMRLFQCCLKCCLLGWVGIFQ